MDRADLIALMDEITEPCLRELNERLHFDCMDRRGWVDLYFAWLPEKPDLEQRCVIVLQELGYDVKTEEEKRTAAAETSAEQSKKANTIAWVAIAISVGSLAAAVFALLKAFGVI
jgi:hypothetical protein